MVGYSKIKHSDERSEEEMIHSNERKLALSGWLKENYNQAYNAPLRMQKFLFFYEAFCKLCEDKADFTALRGYVRGPVFSNVWGDYTKDRDEFDENADRALQKHGKGINVERANKAAFLVTVLSEDELSELTHALNIWSCREKQITAGLQQVSLSEADFSSEDYDLLKKLNEMYSEDLIEDSQVLSLNDKNYVFHKEDIPRLTEHHIDTLFSLSKNAELHNPVFVEVDDRGGLVID